MRILSPAVKKLLASNNVSTFTLVKITPPSGTVIRNTTTATPISFSGQTFTANSGLLSVEPPKLSEVVDREPYKIVYADPAFQLIGDLETSWVGAPVSVWVGFYNTTGASLNGTGIGAPMVASEDYVMAYQGRIDSQGYTIDPDNGAVLAVLDCASPMGALGRINSFYTSKEAMRRRYPNDSSFDAVHTGGEEAAILWGKA